MEELSEYGFSKDRLPKNFSYPLKRSLLDAALDDACVKTAVYSVRYLFSRRRSHTIVQASFVPESSGAHPSVLGRSLITVWAVPSETRKAWEDALVTTGLPMLCEWLEHGVHAGNAWRGKNHHFELRIEDGVLKRVED